MTVADLIDLLGMFPPTAGVTVDDAVVDGASYHHGEVALQLNTDEDDDDDDDDDRLPPTGRRR